MLFKRILKCVLILAIVAGASYGASRLYFHVTHGFTIGNITSNFAYDPRWETPSLAHQDQQKVDDVLSQPFTYLGKGCQSYVFLSDDGKVILKFFKYQRFRPQAWLDYLTFIPGVDEYRLSKIVKKRSKLENLFSSWKIAYENLKPETQLMYVHLNKTDSIKKDIVIYDKMGFKHHLEADKMEFLLQRKAEMLCPYINKLMAKGDIAEANLMLDRIIHLIMSEYQRGLADNDHALMQNTGVYEGYPIHIDVGQFVLNENVKRPEVYKQELFNKTYKFRKWLIKHHPQLIEGFELKLKGIIGDQFDHLKPHFKPHDE